MNVTGNVNITSDVTEAITAGLASSNLAASVSYRKTWANGTGADQINQAFTRTATLAISTPVTLVLSALTDDLGRAVAFTKVREFMLKNNGTADLIMGNAAVAPWGALFGTSTATMKIKPGGVFHYVAPDVNGLPVVATTSDQLKLDPGATACPYELVIKGA